MPERKAIVKVTAATGHLDHHLPRPGRSRPPMASISPHHAPVPGCCPP
jgi:hypothetical protein